MTMTMLSWKAPIVLTVSLLWLAASVPHVQAKPKPKQSDFETMYRIVPRGSGNRRMQADDEDAVLSFDGDLDRIQQLALEEAIRKKNEQGNSESPTLSPTIVTLDGNTGSSDAPSPAPSPLVPTTAAPSASPAPSMAPSDSSMIPSTAPSQSDMPTDTPSAVPSSAPSHSTMPSDTPSMVPSQQPTAPTPVPTSSPTSVLDSATIIACPNIAESKAYTVTWQYSVETLTLSSSAILPFNAQLIVDRRLEERLANEMVPLLLNCWDPVASFDFDLQGLDQQPRDTPSDSDECISDTEGHTCTVFNGQMRLFMPESENANYVFYQARTAIKSILDNPSFHDNVVGLTKSTYLGPAIVIPTSFTDGGNSIEGNEPEDGETLGMTSLILVAVGSAALIVFVGSIFYMRRDSRSSEAGVDGNATQAAGSSIHDYTFPFASPRAMSTSPFSEMLPNAYQFNENMSILSGGMSILSGNVEGLEAVLEQSDEEAQSPRTALSPTHTDTSSILVSESGYTTDAADEEDLDASLSFDVPRSLYTKTPESPDRILLGARRRRESHVTANASILDTSVASDGEMHDEPMLVWTPSKSAGFSEYDDNDDDDDDYNDDLLNLV